MFNQVFSNSLRFVFLILFQVFILNNIQLGGYLNPYLYVLFILMLPFETPKGLLLLLAFFLGISVDMFSNTIGMHAMACLLLAFFRPYIVTYISPRGGYDFGAGPTIKDMGFNWYLSYTGILILAHHILLFNLEVFRLSEFFSTLYRTLLSSVFTLALVIITHYIITGKKS